VSTGVFETERETCDATKAYAVMFSDEYAVTRKESVTNRHRHAMPARRHAHRCRRFQCSHAAFHFVAACHAAARCLPLTVAAMFSCPFMPSFFFFVCCLIFSQRYYASVRRTH